MKARKGKKGGRGKEKREWKKGKSGEVRKRGVEGNGKGKKVQKEGGKEVKEE